MIILDAQASLEPTMSLSLCVCVSISPNTSISYPNEVGSSQNFQDNFLGVSQDDLTCEEWPNPQSPQSGTFIVLKVWLRGWGSWYTSIHARELKFNIQVKNHMQWRSMMSRMTPSTKNPVRNHQHSPSIILRMGGSWHNYIHARELKFGTQVKNHISWWSMMWRMTLSSKYPVKNHQHPPSMTSRTGGSSHTSIHAREMKFGTQVKNHI